jgi:MFS transporter, CP family, cyanate transporter
MTKETSATAASSRSRLRSFLFVLGIVLLAANLRPALTGVAPLIGQIRADSGISNGAAGLLTTLPLLAFALLSPVAPRVARRFGMEVMLLASLLVLATGILLRWAGTVAALFLGTVILGAAIAFGNVLLPGLVKREFPGHAGLMTSVYSTSLGISAALAAGVSVPLAQLDGIGWRGPWRCGLCPPSSPVSHGCPSSVARIIPPVRPARTPPRSRTCGALRWPGG